MMTLANSIIYSLGIRTAILEDDAMINCDGQQVKFFTLRIYQGASQSWYTKFGYHHNFQTPRIKQKYPTYTEKDFYFDLVNLQSFPLFIIIQVIQNLRYLPIQKHYDIILSEGLQVQNILNSKLYTLDTRYLGEYMTKIWMEKDCDAYIAMDRFLRTTSREDIDANGIIFPWGPLLRKIEFVSYELINNFNR